MHGGCMEGGMAFLRTLRGAVRVCVLDALATFPLASAGAQAQSDAATVVVTATRTNQSIDDALSAVTIITRVEIEARQATSVQELLTGEAGVQISNNGGLGKATALFLRGTDADQVLVLIDGVKLTSATLRTTAFTAPRSPLGSDTTSATRRTSRSQRCVPREGPASPGRSSITRASSSRLRA